MTPVEYTFAVNDSPDPFATPTTIVSDACYPAPEESIVIDVIAPLESTEPTEAAAPVPSHWHWIITWSEGSNPDPPSLIVMLSIPELTA